MAVPSVFSRFGNFLKYAYQKISNYLKREKGNPEENQPLLNKENSKPESARAELEKNIKNARAEKEASLEAKYKQVIDTQAKIEATKESKNTQEGKEKLNNLNKLLSGYPSSQTTSSVLQATPSATTETPTTSNSAKSLSPQSPASSREASPASYDEAKERVKNREIEQALRGFSTTSSEAQLIKITTDNFDKEFEKRNPALLKLIKEEEERKILSREASPASSREASPANSREASYRVISMDPVAQKVLDSKIEQATKGITDKSEISRIQQLVKADFDKKLLTNDPALDREIKEKKLELQREASPENSITSSPTTSRGVSPTTSRDSPAVTQVKSILKSQQDLSGDQSPTRITWQDGRSKNTRRGVGEKLESPAFSPSSPSSPASPASPSSPASPARTAYTGSPRIQFPDLDPEVTKLAEAAVIQARLSGRGVIEAEKDRQRATIQQGHWKQVEDMRTEIAPAQASVVESFFSRIANNIGIGGQTPVEASTSAPAPAPSNQAIVSPEQIQKPKEREYIPVFATPPREDKENSGQGTSSRGSSNTGRTPFSPNNSFNTTRSNSESASSSSETGTSSRTGTSSGTQRTSSSTSSGKSVMVAGTKVKGTPAQVEAMQEDLSFRGRSSNSVAARTSEIEEKISIEDSAGKAFAKEQKRAKGTHPGHAATSVTVRERDGLRTFGGFVARASNVGVEPLGRGGSTGR